MILYIDIDNTICFSSGLSYDLAKPNYDNIDKVNKLHNLGHTIVMWTARGSLTNINWFQVTTQQLNEWNVKYHELRMGKPAFDLLIDDKALNSIHHWDNLNFNKSINQVKSNQIELNKDRWIGEGHPCLIIAEIGQNHQGSLEIAKEMIRMVKDCGADVAKFQKTTIEAKFNKKALDRPYTTKNSWGKTYGEHKRYLEFSDEEFIELKNYAEEIGIIFAASGMDIPAFDFLNKIDIPFLKIGSGDTNNLELIEHISKFNKPIILSTGMNDLKSVTKSLELAQKYNDKICLLQCTSSYPLPEDEVNLNVIKTYQDNFGHNTIIGYSGHETGSAISLGSIAIGAKIIERHVTLDKKLKGTDHSASLEPAELKQLCQDIRLLEKALGDGIKKNQPSEKACNDKLGKSIVLTKNLKVNHILKKEDMTVKVADPKGLNPNIMFEILGKKINKDKDFDETLTNEDLVL